MCLVAQSCLTLCDPMDCSPPGSSVRGDSPGTGTGVGCMPSSRGSSQPRDWNPDLPHCRCECTLSRQESAFFSQLMFIMSTNKTYSSIWDLWYRWVVKCSCDIDSGVQRSCISSHVGTWLSYGLTELHCTYRQGKVKSYSLSDCSVGQRSWVTLRC